MTYSLLYQGSVKNLLQSSEDLLFEYSDRYSLFDWGEMPDQLTGKGEALAMMGALFFKELDKHGVPHHFLGLSDQNGQEKNWEPTRFLKVKKIPVYRPPITENDYDYSFYKTKPQVGLVPLEVMFRFGAGKGSSLTKRIEKDPTLLAQWNLKRLESDKLWDLPLIDFSTKLEKGDRYLTHAEAQDVAGLNDVEFSSLVEGTVKVAMILRALFGSMNLELWDGKLEWGFLPGANRSFMLVDSIGLDELRLQKKGRSLSKEFLREHYRKTNWYKHLTMAKEVAGTTGEDFKKLCAENPPLLPEQEKQHAISLYLSFTNDLAQKVLGRPVFEQKYSLENWERGL